MIYLVLVLTMMGEFSASALPFASLAECEAKRSEVAERIKAEAKELKEMGVTIVSLRCEAVKE
jgi:hypothetical protein